MNVAAPAWQAGIVDAACHLPGPALDLVQWGPRTGLADATIAGLLANGCRHFHAASGQSDADLAVAALQPLLARHDVDPARIAYVVHAHSQNFSVPPAPQSLLAEVAQRCGLRPRLALAVGELACAGVVKAVEVALRLLQHDATAGHALVLCADRVFGGPTFRVRQASGLQSDAGAAILLGRRGLRARVADVFVRHLPGLAAGPGAPEVDRRLGPLLWAQTRRVLQEVDARPGGGLATLGAIYPTNDDGPYWQKLAALLGLPPERVFVRNIRERGHACSADVAMNLADDGFARLAAGHRILCFSQSNVGAYGSLLLEPVPC